MPPGRSMTCASDAGGDQAHDLVVQQLAVAAALLVPDHQVDREALQAPVGVRLHQLAHQFDVGGVLPICTSTIGRSPEIA